MKSFLNSISEFVEYHLPTESDSALSESTNILDPYIGNIDLQGHEIDFLNSPLMQRLRQIHQMAFTYFTYPTAKHSRFEHSLGVVRQSAVLARNVQTREPGMLDGTAIREIRLAALLHDCGHGCFSHSSEAYYGKFKEINIIRKDRPEMRFAAPHEILSCLIIESEPFEYFLRTVRKRHRVDIDINEVKNCILGVSNTFRKFKSEIINGPFDADKLDYVLRDSIQLGIGGPTFAELEILMSKIDVSWIEDSPRMSISSERLSTIEHLLFSKMLMFSAVYSQASLRACECMLHGVFDYCRKNNISLNGRKLDTPIDFLWTTDYLLMAEGQRTKDRILANLLQNLSFRRFLIPAVSISIYSVKDRHTLDGLFRLREKPGNYRRIAEAIWLEAKKPCLLEEVWLDDPGIPSLHSFDTIPVTMPDGRVMPLFDIIPLSTWASTFLHHKWRSYVFCPREHRGVIQKAAAKVLTEEFNLTLNSSAFSSE